MIYNSRNIIHLLIKFFFTLLSTSYYNMIMLIQIIIIDIINIWIMNCKNLLYNDICSIIQEVIIKLSYK